MHGLTKFLRGVQNFGSNIWQRVYRLGRGRFRGPFVLTARFLLRPVCTISLMNCVLIIAISYELYVNLFRTFKRTIVMMKMGGSD